MQQKKQPINKKIVISIGGSILVITIIILLVAFSTATSGSGDHRGMRSMVPLVKAEPVEIRTLEKRERFTGEVVARNQISITPRVDGIIKSMPWLEGDDVKKGDLLVRIDDTSYALQKKNREAALILAKARYEELLHSVQPAEIEKAELNVAKLKEEVEYYEDYTARIESLYQKNVIAKDEYDKAHLTYVTKRTEYLTALEQLEILRNTPTPAQLQVQEAAIKQAEVDLATAMVNLRECTIYAPNAGVISSVHAHVGEQARPGTVILELVDMTQTVIQFAVTESYAPSIQKGTTIEYTLDSLPGKTFHSEIIRKYPVLDPETRTLTLEAAIDRELDLHPGMFVRIALILQQKEHILTIPRAALNLSAQNESFVYVVEDKKAKIRTIRTGIEDDAYVEILDGLEEGELVVTIGQDMLTDNSEVRLEGEKPPPPAAAGQNPLDQPPTTTTTSTAGSTA